MKMKQITFKIDRNMLELLNAYAYSIKMQRSQIIREAINLLLQRGILQQDKLSLENLRPITFKIDEKTLSKLDEFVKKNNLNRSDVIRIAINQYIEEKQNMIRSVKVEKIRLW